MAAGQQWYLLPYDYKIFDNESYTLYKFVIITQGAYLLKQNLFIGFDSPQTQYSFFLAQSGCLGCFTNIHNRRLAVGILI